jgi:ubiquinone/menaquinone biosynthesis C-methylase UbiE
MQHWSAYWQQADTLNSFAEGQAASGYHGELADFWQQQLATLPPSATLIDLGTGNGALALLLAEQKQQQATNWRILAVDAADIQPQRLIASQPALATPFQLIRFLGHTRIEQLPCANASIDLLVSQFAFEYSDLSASLQEALRVLKPSGRLVAVMHSADTPLAQDSAVGIRVMQSLLAARGIIERVQELLALVLQSTQSPQFIQANQQLLQQVKAYQQSLAPAAAEWFHYLFAPFAGLLFQPVADSLQQAKRLQQSLAFYLQRLSDQQAACITPEKADGIQQQLQQLRGRGQLAPLYIEGQLFGLALIAEKV